MDRNDRERLLRVYPVLRELPTGLWRRVEETAELARVPAGQRLFAEGARCTHYPLLLEGTIRASKFSPEGDPILLYRVNPGEGCALTVAALLGEASYPATATAETTLRVYRLGRGVFLEMVLGSPAFRDFVFKFLSRRLAHLVALVDEVAFRRVDQRLASRLIMGRPRLASTHQRLADDLGTSREVVSRILETFQRSGMIRLGRKHIEIVDGKALDRLQRTER
jgi:CRP/FNR family transcriptional regulator, anaerobic regulatory protein